MAKALFNNLAQRRGLTSRAESAGTNESDQIHINVVQVMHEVGLDLSNEHPRHVTNRMVEQTDQVITMGCTVDTTECPALIFKVDMKDWGILDPQGKSIDEVRAIRDTIHQMVEGLLNQGI